MILGTWKCYGFVEHNFLPSPEIQKVVLDAHRHVLYHSKKTSIMHEIISRSVALFTIILISPLIAIIMLMIWLEDPGPVFFVKNSVGKDGRNFKQLKFRTMIYDAERITGPVLASHDDNRTLIVGRFLRKTALDEIPQLFNILAGEMAFVGPRPQRTILVAEYLKDMPEFAERHAVLPGMAGLAQVAGSYYISPRQKLRFDRIYIAHASLGFDLKLIGLAFMLVFWLRWRRNWNGRIPRRWMRLFSRGG